MGGLLIKQKVFNKSLLTGLAFIVLAIALLTALIYHDTIVVNPNTIPINSGPGVNYSRLNVSSPKRVLIIGEKRNWYQIRLNDHQSAWVPSWLIHSKRPLNKQNHLAGAIIAIDPGHGGSDSGAEYKNNSAKNKYMEKTYTLQIARQLALQLQAAGAQVVLTRSADKAVGLKERVRIAENDHVDCFVSLHLNSSKTLARQVSHQFSGFPISNRGVEFGDFLVIRDTKLPAILCETGYVNTTKDFKNIRQKSFQKKAVRAITKGINQYLAIQK